MSKKIHFVSTTIDKSKHVDSDFYADVEITYTSKNTVLDYVDNESCKTTITCNSHFINVKRFGEANSSLDLILDENTMYVAKTPYGDFSLGINALDILVNNQFIYAKYYIQPDTDIYHEIMITIIEES